MSRIFFFTLLAGFFLAGCESSNKPDDLIKEPVYIDLLTEIFLTEGLVELIEDGQQKKDSLMTVVFDRYDVTPDQFERSHEYYQRQGSEQLARADSVRKKLRSERDAMIQAQRNE